MNILYLYYFMYFLICFLIFYLMYFKEIWIFFIGNILSNIVFVLLHVILVDKKKLYLIHKVLGWFFIEHIYDYYQKKYW